MFNSARVCVGPSRLRTGMAGYHSTDLLNHLPFGDREICA